jgi:hypothetical protein
LTQPLVGMKRKSGNEYDGKYKKYDCHEISLRRGSRQLSYTS